MSEKYQQYYKRKQQYFVSYIYYIYLAQVEVVQGIKSPFLSLRHVLNSSFWPRGRKRKKDGKKSTAKRALQVGETPKVLQMSLSCWALKLHWGQTLKKQRHTPFRLRLPMNLLYIKEIKPICRVSIVSNNRTASIKRT